MRSCKKYLLLLGLLLMAAVGGCGGIGYEETDENKPVTIKGPEGLPTNPKILIAYFSHTGNTELAAWQIQAAVGGQLFAIQTEVPYPQDKSECGKIAKQELAGNERPPLAADLADISQYDTIFLGYPIWFDEAPAMIATFLEENEFEDKTIIPFCTSASDTIENSLHIFEELCPDAELEEGLTANDEEDIEPWLEELELLS